MVEENSELLEKARRAQEKLVNQFLNHPDVSLIDIGYAPEGQQEELVLRIHVRDQWIQASPTERITFPSEIDGFPILIIRGDYQIERN